jgi:diguanylate cyclase (GGDEF)-like protein
VLKVTTIERKEDGSECTIRLEGSFLQPFELESSVTELNTEKVVNIDLSLVENMPHAGELAWVKIFGTLAKERKIIFHNSPPYLTAKMSTIPSFLPVGSTVASFFVPYLQTNRSEEKIKNWLFTAGVDYRSGEALPDLPDKIDEKSGDLYTPNIVPNSYLSFLPEYILRKYSIFDQLYDCFFVINQQREIIYSNAAAVNLTGVSTKRMTKKGKSFNDFVEISNLNLFCMPGGEIGRDEPSSYEEVTYTNKKGEGGSILISITPDKDSIESNRCWIISLHSTDLEQTLQHKYKDQSAKTNEMTLLAKTDEMTELANYRAFMDALSVEVSRAIRFQQNLSVVILDVDKFKVFNDTYGHQQGDMTLKILAKTLQINSRECDLPARYGGEEFVLILPQTNLDGLRAAMEKYRKAIEDMEIPYVKKEGEFLKATASFGGLAIDFSKHDRSFPFDMKHFIKVADSNLYKSKEGGRNCCTASEWEDGMPESIS